MLRQLIDKIKSNNFERIIVELVIFTLLFNINTILSIIMLMVIVVEIIMSKSNENLLFIYLFLSFFDEILKIDIIGGSVSRIVMVFTILKLLFYIFKNKILPNKYQISIIIFFLISFFTGILTGEFSMEVITILFNIAILVCFSMVLKFNKIEEINEFIEKLCFTIVWATLNSILYGVINGNYLKEILEDKVIYRFNGTYEPNFMCMYINLGILALLTIKDKFFNKYFYYASIAIMITAAIATVSVTGIGTLGIIIILYLFFNRKNFKEELKDFAIIIVLTAILLTGIFIAINLCSSIEHMNDTEINNSQMNDIEINNSQINEENRSEMTNEIREEIKDYEMIENDNKLELNTEEIEKKENEKNALIKRIETMIEFINNGEFDKLTSGRIPLAKVFIQASFNRPVINILIGNDATNKKVYCSFFDKECYSHNTYVDFLYNFGVIGFAIIVSYVLYETIKNKYLGFDLSNTKYSNNIKLIRIMLLIYAIALTLYTKRMFLIFFLL